MNELERNLIADGFGAPPSHILEALDEELARRRFPEILHSIYDEIWHVTYWLEITLDWIAGKPTPYPEHSSLSFPSSYTESWTALRERFFHATENAAALARDAAKLETPSVRPSREPSQMRSQSVRELLEGLAAHDAYHLGRVVLLRQLFGAWPPPSGGDTW